MKYILPVLVALVLPTLTLPTLASAADAIRVTQADVAAPDPELRKVLAELRSLAAAGSAKNIPKVEAYFASGTKTFTRGLDPFEPWRQGPKLTGDYLSGMADAMVEQGEFVEGRPAPDYRLGAMELLASLVSDDAVFGAMPEVPGALCSPAAYKVDRKAVRAFAKRFKLDAHSLFFFAEDVVLVKTPGEKRGERIPANTLMISDNELDMPEGWTRAETSSGARGYLRLRDDTPGLSQDHVCFAKVKGKYRITAIFGYGL